MPETRRTGSRSGLSTLPDRRKQGRQGTSGMASPASVPPPATLVGLRAADGAVVEGGEGGEDGEDGEG